MRILYHVWLVFGVLILAACSNNKGFDAMGVFEGDEWLVSSEISGKIVSLDVFEGEAVTKGQKLGEIDSLPMRLKLKKLELELDFTKQEVGRLQRLYKANATPKQTLDQMALKLDILRSEREILLDSIKRSEIIAPGNGVILKKYALSGELANPNKALLRIVDTRHIRLKAYCNSMDLSRVKLGESVLVRADFGGEYREYKGVISFISSEAEFTPKSIMTKDERENLVYMIKVDVENDGFLKIGGYGEVVLQP